MNNSARIFAWIQDNSEWILFYSVFSVPIHQWIEELRPVFSFVILTAGAITAVFSMFITIRKWFKNSYLNKNRNHDSKKDNDKKDGN